MDRRTFLKISGGLVFLSACKDVLSLKDIEQRKKFPIHVDSNRSIGHLVRTAVTQKVSSSEEVETLIVGGGIAGLSAACSLPNKNYVVCELDPTFGGTSGAVDISGNLYSQGAHYDLAYPSNFGNDGIQLLHRLGIIEFNDKHNLWEFIDKQYLIPSDKEEACYYNGAIRASVLENTILKQNFIALLNEYSEQVPLPSTDVSEELKKLDELSFYDYLNKYLPIDNYFIEAIDYQMLDDWGGTSTQVSALAGIYYYKCRPYYEGKEIALFSPTEGNYYFIKKMMAQLEQDRLKNNHLVFQLREENNKWIADVFDHANQTRKQFVADRVVYAGQKHALKYIHPESYVSFSDVSYAPWVVVNIEMEDCSLKNSKWQNDFLSSDNSFLGFVDSKQQDESKNRVLTAYYCFPDIHHYLVKNFEESAETLVHESIDKISQYYQEDISDFVKQAHVKLLGHAMPIPEPGYLSRPRIVEKNGLAFAGVDSGRLPLMFEAMDSGIQAVKALYS